MTAPQPAPAAAPAPPPQPAEPPPVEVAVDDLADWIAAYREADRNARQWRETADRAKQHITAHLDAHGAEVGTIGGRTAVRWTTVDRGRFDTAKFREQFPELADQFTVSSPSRRFTLKD